MKHLRTIALAVIAMFTFNTNVAAQVEAKAVQDFSISGGKWRKIIHSGDLVTVFAYKKKSDIYTFGIYSDDYAGIIDMKINPFDIEPKQLKKLPDAQGKNISLKLKEYYNMARSKAREKALAGKYKTTSPVTLIPNSLADSYLFENVPFTIYGYKEVSDFRGIACHFSIVNNDYAGIFHSSPVDNIVIDIPLAFLPSTDDSQVKYFIEKENKRILARRETEEKARKEEQERLKKEERKATAEREAAAIKEIKEEELAFLRSHAPAYIEIEGWSMDSANGIAVDIAFKNGSSQKVKYVYFKGYFLNAVGDKCRNEISGSTEWKYRGVGPVNALPDTPYYINYNHIAHWHFSNPRFYSGIANTFHLSSVTIEYTNGKKTTLSGAELKKRVRYL